MNGEKIFVGILLSVLGLAFFTVFTSLWAVKKIDCYYTTSDYAPLYAVKASIDWDGDPVVFKTKDFNEFRLYISAVEMCAFKEPDNNPKA